MRATTISAEHFEQEQVTSLGPGEPAAHKTTEKSSIEKAEAAITKIFNDGYAEIGNAFAEVDEYHADHVGGVETFARVIHYQHSHDTSPTKCADVRFNERPSTINMLSCQRTDSPRDEMSAALKFQLEAVNSHEEDDIIEAFVRSVQIHGPDHEHQDDPSVGKSERKLVDVADRVPSVSFVENAHVNQRAPNTTAFLGDENNKHFQDDTTTKISTHPDHQAHTDSHFASGPNITQLQDESLSHEQVRAGKHYDE